MRAGTREVVRAVRRTDPTGVPRARQALSELTLIGVGKTLYDVAADLDPPLLRSLDALHLAAALSVSGELAAVVTYDVRMTEAADALGLTVVAPA